MSEGSPAASMMIVTRLLTIVSMTDELPCSGVTLDAVGDDARADDVSFDEDNELVELDEATTELALEFALDCEKDNTDGMKDPKSNSKAGKEPRRRPMARGREQVADNSAFRCCPLLCCAERKSSMSSHPSSH